MKAIWIRQWVGYGLLLSFLILISCGPASENNTESSLSADEDSDFYSQESAQTSVNTKLSKSIRPAKVTSSTTAKFKFSCTAGTCTYKCWLDANPWKKCKSPKTYTGLAEGAHSFKVKATNSQGQTDPSPAKYNWSIIFWTQISAGSNHTCGVRTNGTLWCWGRNFYGQLGDGTTVGLRKLPTQIGALNTWAEVSGGEEHTCGRKTDGTLWCWGMGNYGQRGDGTWDDQNVPTQVGLLNSWSAVNTGGMHTCGRKGDGTIWCWGGNQYGQLGDGTTVVARNTPTQVGALNSWAEIKAGGHHNCARKTEGTLWCWGYNPYGQLGDGTTVNKNTPAQLGVDTTWTELYPGAYHNCAGKSDHSLWCWGYNKYGQLGDGTTADKKTPIRVRQ